MAKLKSDYITAPSVDMFYNIIYACFWHGDFKMTQHVYDRMETLKVVPDSRIKYLFFQKERKDNIDRLNQKNKKDDGPRDKGGSSLLMSGAVSNRMLKNRSGNSHLSRV